MHLTRLPNGTLLVELDGRAFAEMLKDAPQSTKLQLPDKRPAIAKYAPRTTLEDSEQTYYTLHWYIWERIRSLPQYQNVPSRTRLCDNCGTALKVKEEREDHWLFACPRCDTREFWGKQLIGGTIGAGQREKT